jgi:hypothetical protein
LSDLTDAMVEHIYHIVHDEQRPFSYRDFMKFEVEGQEYKMAHGTFRNTISRLMKERLVEVSYKSNITFYTLRNVKFNKAHRMAVTGNHTGVHIISSVAAPSNRSSNPLYRIVRDLPLGKNAVHDIRLRFASPEIYAITSSLISNNALRYDYTVNSRSKEIILPVWEIRGLLIKVTIHRTDTVSVVIGCSLDPVVLDVNGIIRLTNVLSILEERLSRVVDGSHGAKGVKGFSLNVDPDTSSCAGHRDASIIPAHSEWIVTMWHFGADASVEYCGEKFSVTWETAENALVRAYSKVMNDNKTRIRLERQEYPRISLVDAIERRLHSNSKSWDMAA